MKNEKIVDVFHIVDKNNKNVHIRLDKTLEQCNTYGINDYDSYSFYEVEDVDGFCINVD